MKIKRNEITKQIQKIKLKNRKTKKIEQFVWMCCNLAIFINCSSPHLPKCYKIKFQLLFINLRLKKNSNKKKSLIYLIDFVLDEQGRLNNDFAVVYTSYCMFSRLVWQPAWFWCWQCVLSVSMKCWKTVDCFSRRIHHFRFAQRQKKLSLLVIFFVANRSRIFARWWKIGIVEISKSREAMSELFFFFLVQLRRLTFHLRLCEVVLRNTRMTDLF